MRNYKFIIKEVVVSSVLPLLIFAVALLMIWGIKQNLSSNDTVSIGDTVYILEVQENDDIYIKQGLVESVAFSDGIKYYIVKIAYRYDLAEFDIIAYRYDYVFKTEKSAIKKVEELQG